MFGLVWFVLFRFCFVGFFLGGVGEGGKEGGKTAVTRFGLKIFDCRKLVNHFDKE